MLQAETHIRRIDVWVVSRIRGTFFGSLILRIMVFGTTLGFPYFGKVPYNSSTEYGTAR